MGAWFLAPLIGVSYKVAVLILMCAGYLFLSGLVEFGQYRLRKQLLILSEEERALVGTDDPEIRFAFKAAGSASPRLTTLVGATFINGPLIPLMVGPLALLQYGFNIREPVASASTLVLGFVLAWGWWSAGVTVWRWWAIRRRGMPPEEAQWRGERASFLWPRGHILERTELGHLLSSRLGRLDK